jgi:amino acid adenylation domain-containing protein
MSNASLARPLTELPPEWLPRDAFRSAAGALTFGQLREGALRAATWLAAEHGIRAGDRVALCLPKNVETIQLILAVLAVGGVIVPLQWQGPPARLNRILRSVRPSLLLATMEMADRLAGEAQWPEVSLCSLAGSGKELGGLMSGAAVADSIAHRAVDDLAAIYFTSGSTGEPKGVMLSHGNVTAGMNLVIRQDRLGPGDCLCIQSSLQYAAYDIFLPLVLGCRAYLLSNQETMVPRSIAATMERERVTVWKMPVSSMRLLLESGELAGKDFSRLRLIGFFGESMPIHMLRHLMAAVPSAEVTINYGATEAYRISTLRVPRALPQDVGLLSVGAVDEEYSLTILGDDGREVETGKVGEICVEGGTVMLGYWDDPAMTARRRLDGRARSWRTGDQGYRDSQGRLHLLGRRDHMVKLRGHRFELGEIEAAIKTHPEVLDAVAFAVEIPGKETEVRVAVLQRRGLSPAGALHKLCAEKLPSFARPARIVQLEQFPLLPTGKTDRIALKRMIAVMPESAGMSQLSRH